MVRRKPALLAGLIALGLTAWLGSVDASGQGLATALAPAVTFDPHQRAVSNWRLEGALHLDTSVAVATALVLGREAAQVTRCVRLNNYWCIKRAGWTGEIAADAEDHVAFASAAQGADVAALLLRRYYIDYGRHSASAIVSHWAPASCGLAAAPRNHAVIRSSPADGLATRGLRHTLRARFLAAHGRRVAGGGRMRGRGSAVPDRLIGASTPTPSIALDTGDAPLDLGIASLASLSSPLLGTPSRALPDRPERGCIADDTRIRNYAAKLAAGIALGGDGDLKLFDAAGLPTANLARAMRNMAAVEIGPLGAGGALIGAAVEHVRQLARTRAAAGMPSTRP